MKTAIGLLGAIACGGAILIGSRATLPAPAPLEVTATATSTLPEDQFIVHEWGTFTSFSGSNSVKLEFRPLVSSDLPYFVLDRHRQIGMFPLFVKNYIPAMQRMETPVTYFYSDKPRQVQVRVNFPKGLLTEFYPPVEKMLPEINDEQRYRGSGSSLDWGRVMIIPPERLQVNVGDPEMASHIQGAILRSIVPNATGNEHYGYARETDSALLFVERPKNNNAVAPQGGYFEKFLFYRGLGHFDLPLKMSSYAGNAYELENVGGREIRSLFLVTVAGDQLRYAKYGSIAPGARLKMAQVQQNSSADALSDDMVRALTAEGLYEKEARAMVKTWRSSWFEEQGTRLFHMLPQATIDELLPLTIKPQPDKMLRVMVGRLEIMRPEDEARAVELVKQSAAARAAHYKAMAQASQAQQKPYPIPQPIVALGRLAEPALVRVKMLTRDPQVHNEVQLLLAELLHPRS